MTATTYQAIAMIVYFVAMLAIGGWAYLRTDNFDDYMLADRDLNPWVAALSAGASDMSGWLLMGLPGPPTAATASNTRSLLALNGIRTVLPWRITVTSDELLLAIFTTACG